MSGAGISPLTRCAGRSRWLPTARCTPGTRRSGATEPRPAPRIQALRRLGPEPDNAVACPLRRPGRDDLLARGTRLAVHPLPTQVAVLVGGGVDDRGRGPPLHRDGG